MILGIGIDIAENSRFENLSDGMLSKIYTANEISQLALRVDKAQFLASRFAAKEAFVKALGTGFGSVGAKDIEICNDVAGRPYITLLKDVCVHGRIHLSISHEKTNSIAMVVIEDGSI